MRIGPEPALQNQLLTSSKSLSRSHTAVIFANNLDAFGFGSPMPEVGALPILLRSILGAHKAGASRIVVIIDVAKGRCMRDEVLQTGRIPRSVEWCEFNFGQASLPSYLGRLAVDVDGHLVLIAGDSVYHPSLHRRAAEWSRERDALALKTGDELVGICALSRDAVIDLARRCPAVANSIADVLAWLALTHSVAIEPVAEEKWHRVTTEQERLSAERKLNGWLVKPTDGIFARMNRKLSIPISRQIISFPITPNMVSLFTLGVSFAAGAFLALGDYWNMLTGAILSWLASVLDGCDGEVARLKLQESDFGCWLETVCDYLYYLFIFVGMTIGLVRSSGNHTFLVWGGLLVFGAIASILTTGMQRHHLTSGRPEQYLGAWQEQAESRSSNPFLFLGRHTEFIIRRCFLPYVFLFFALFHIMNWLLIAGAVGANLVWMIALYSYLTFVPARPSTVPNAVS
jgi:phosphatidylglycerophosphate synthase